MLRAKKQQENILIMNAEDFTSSYTSELLAHLEDVPDLRKGDTLNFPTRTVFRGMENNRVITAFNMYLQRLSHEVDRIIITL